MNIDPVQVKICGITNAGDASLAAELGADAIGLNFYRKSPRYISPADARVVVSAIPDGVKVVGVFVNSGAEEIEDIVSLCSLGLIQLHGDEDALLIEDIKRRTQAKVMRAVRVNSEFEPLNVAKIPADEFLLDSHTASFGGSGEAFDWSEAVLLKKALPRFFLAGGLTPDNVAAAIRQVRPWGVDVCSGVERAPGIKDPEKLRRFISEARNA